MIKTLNSPEAGDKLCVSQVAGDELRVRGDILDIPTREIVCCYNLHAKLQTFIDDVRPDEPRGAGDECLTGGASRPDGNRAGEIFARHRRKSLQLSDEPDWGKPVLVKSSGTAT